MLAGCKMKCDEQPCKNQGICIEDFQKQEVTCNCEHTSFYGELCDEGTSYLSSLCTEAASIGQVIWTWENYIF